MGLALSTPKFSGSSRKATEDVIRDLLDGGNIPRWSIADPGFIGELATGRPQARTHVGRAVDAFFDKAGLSEGGLVALRVLSLAAALMWWLTSARPSWQARYVQAVFLGFGAGSEEALYRRFESECAAPARLRLDSLAHASLGLLCRPRLARLLRLLWSESRALQRRLRSASSELVTKHEGRWAASAARRLPQLVYFAAWAEQLPKTVERIVVISLDARSFGVTQGLRSRNAVSVEYWQHGFLSRNLVGPQGLSLVRALNAPEGRFLASRCPGSRLEIVPLVGGAGERVVGRMCRRLLFASQYDAVDFQKEHELGALQALLDWAGVEGLEFIVRLHPREDEKFWQTHFPSVMVDRAREDFRSCLARLHPILVCSWWSTAVLDALNLGVLPVVLKSAECRPANVVFPFGQVGIGFPGERDLLMSVVQSPDAYSYELARRREIVDPSSVRDASARRSGQKRPRRL